MKHGWIRWGGWERLELRIGGHRSHDSSDRREGREEEVLGDGKPRQSITGLHI